MKKKSRVVKTVVGVIVLTTLIVVTYRWMFPPSIAQQASNYLNAIERGSGKEVFGYLDGSEIKALGLTPEKVEAVLKQVVRPRFAMMRPGVGWSEVQAAGSEGVAGRELIGEDGRKYQVFIALFESEGGPKTLLSSVIQAAWHVEYIYREGKEYEARTVREAILQGVRSDRDTLTKIGVPGLVDFPPYAEMRTWDRLESEMVAKLAR